MPEVPSSTLGDDMHILAEKEFDDSEPFTKKGNVRRQTRLSLPLQTHQTDQKEVLCKE